MLRYKKIIRFISIIFIIAFVLMICIFINRHILIKEFGQNIYLYKSRDCFDISKPFSEKWIGLEDCEIFWHSVYIPLLYPKTLNEGLNYVINTVPNRDKLNNLINTLKNYPENPSDWICALTPSGKIVENNDKEKIKPDSQYKCWPKNR